MSKLSRYAAVWLEGASSARITNHEPYFSYLYRYKRLDPLKNEIRLLTIAPAAPLDLIRCQIQTVSLDNAPPYKDLSYFWDYGRGYRKIYLEGYQYQVTENLAAALDQLSQPSYGVQLIWIGTERNTAEN